MNLIESIRQGESKTLELKAQLPQHEQIAKTAVAFANTSGGKLVIGVSDDRQVVGLPEEDVIALQSQIGSIIFDRCHPAILPEMYTANLEGKTVLVVEVFRGNLLPYGKRATSWTWSSTGRRRGPARCPIQSEARPITTVNVRSRPIMDDCGRFGT